MYRTFCGTYCVLGHAELLYYSRYCSVCNSTVLSYRLQCTIALDYTVVFVGGANGSDGGWGKHLVYYRTDIQVRQNKSQVAGQVACSSQFKK